MADKKNKKILEIALKRFKLAEEAENDSRIEELEDIRFKSGDHWPAEIRADRERDGRPCLTINKIPQFVKQVTNDQRQNRPAIRVSPVDDKADVETAKIFQGLIRHTEYNSNADVAYDTAFEGAVSSGIGYMRVITDYISPDSFNQEPKIEMIKNRFSVYADPYFVKPDGSDMRFCFITDDIPKEEFIEQYGESKLAGMEDWTSIGNEYQGWAEDDSCRIAEYYSIEHTESKIYLLHDGRTLKQDELDKELLDQQIPEELKDELIKDTRTSRAPRVVWRKITAVDVLEETIFPGTYIPVIPVVGDEIVVDGKLIRHGIIRNARDPQKMYNYWKSAETEMIALAPKAPYIAAEGQIAGHERIWSTANTENHSVLTYKPVSIGGAMVGAPQRNVYEPPVMAINNAGRGASEDIKATTGIYDASLGARSNENSGIAIQRRNQQSQTGNFHYVDNLSISLRHLGRILVQILPVVLDVPRTQRIIGEDGEQEIVMINQIFEDKKTKKVLLYDLSAGKYDVTVDTGPSYATKRQEALESMLSLTQHYPQMVQYAGDLILKNMDWNGSDDIAARLKKTIPPELLEKDESQQQIPPEVQAQLEQSGQLIEQLTEKLNEASEDRKMKSMELESKEKLEFAKLETQLRIKLMDAQAKAGLLDQQSALRELEQLQQSQNTQGLYQEPEDQNEFNDMGQPPQGQPPMSIEQPTGGFAPGQPLTGEQAPGEFVEE